MSGSNSLSTFWDHLSSPSTRPLKMGPIGCPETSVRNYRYWLRNDLEECSSQLRSGGSLKSLPVVTVRGGQLKCDGTRAETRFRLSAKRTSPFKSAGDSVQSTTGSRGVCIRGSNAGYTMLRGSVKSTGYPLHSPVYPSLPLPCVTVCHHVSTGLYHQFNMPLHSAVTVFCVDLRTNSD